MNQYIGAHGRRSLGQFPSVVSEISRWESVKTGEIVLTIPDSVYTPARRYVVVTELEIIGDNFMIATGGNLPGLREVTVRPASGSASATTYREECQYLHR